MLELLLKKLLGYASFWGIQSLRTTPPQILFLKKSLSISTRVVSVFKEHISVTMVTITSPGSIQNLYGSNIILSLIFQVLCSLKIKKTIII